MSATNSQTPTPAPLAARPGSAIPEWAAAEIRETWNSARASGSELQAFRIIERMVDRLGYGRTQGNPPLSPNASPSATEAGR